MAGKKRKRNETASSAIEEDLPLTKKSQAQTPTSDVGQLDSRLLADLLAQKTIRFEKDLSSIELEERFLSAKHIRDCSSWQGLRTIEKLPDFLEVLSMDRDKEFKLNSASAEKGAPHTLVVTGAGLRAADLARALRVFQSSGHVVAKLFAKHIKLADTVKFLRNMRVSAAVGTPQRILDLLRNGALSTKSLRTLVVDASHVDQKKRSILEMRETNVPLVSLLNLQIIKSRLGTIGSEKIDLVFF